MQLASQIKYIPVFFILSFIAILCGCSQESHVKFKIKNIGTTNIFVKYHAFQSSDTIDVQIAPTETAIVWDALHVGGSKYATNWYYDYGIQINNITNTIGDSTTFDPNIAGYWNIANGDEVNYLLFISDTSF